MTSQFQPDLKPLRFGPLGLDFAKRRLLLVSVSCSVKSRFVHTLCLLLHVTLLILRKPHREVLLLRKALRGVYLIVRKRLETRFGSQRKSANTCAPSP